MIVIPEMRAQRWDPQGLLASQPSQIGDPQVNERPCLKEQGRQLLGNDAHAQ